MRRSFASRTHPYLSAKPDGIIDDYIYVEVKCPYTARKNIISPETVNYLQPCKRERLCELNENLNYDHQPQANYFVLKGLYLLIIFTSREIMFVLFIPVQKNLNSVKDVVDKLDLFYSRYYKTGYLNKYLYKYSKFDKKIFWPLP